MSTFPVVCSEMQLSFVFINSLRKQRKVHRQLDTWNKLCEVVNHTNCVGTEKEQSYHGFKLTILYANVWDLLEYRNLFIPASKLM